MIGPTKGALLLEGYLHVITTDTHSHLSSTKPTLQGSTLLHYLKAASLWFHTELSIEVPVICPSAQKILPPYHDPIAQVFKWATPQPKCKPYTHQMIMTFSKQVRTKLETDLHNHASQFFYHV